MEDELLWIPTKLVLPPFVICICYQSHFNLDNKNDWVQEYIWFLNGKSDRTVLSGGIRYACENWKSDQKSLFYIDVEKENSKHFDHRRLSSNPFVLDLATNGDPDKNIRD